MYVKCRYPPDNYHIIQKSHLSRWFSLYPRVGYGFVPLEGIIPIPSSHPSWVLRPGKSGQEQELQAVFRWVSRKTRLPYLPEVKNSEFAAWKKSRAPKGKDHLPYSPFFGEVEISKAEKKGWNKNSYIPIYGAIYRWIIILFLTIGRGPPYVSWHVWKAEKIRIDCSTHWKISKHWAKCFAHSNQDEKHANK